MKNNILNANTSEQIQRFNSSILELDWDKINFDSPEFACGLNISANSLTDIHNIFLDDLIYLIPEWKKIIGRKQHKTHDYTLDIHILTVIKKLKEQKQFIDLDDYCKLILLWGGLLHDIEKEENIVDPMHPAKGAETALNILNRLQFNEETINDIYTIVKYHPVVGFIAIDRIEFDIDDLMNKFGSYEMANLLVIFARADIKSVKANNAFYNDIIDKNINRIYQEILRYNNKIV